MFVDDTRLTCDGVISLPIGRGLSASTSGTAMLLKTTFILFAPFIAACSSPEGSSPGVVVDIAVHGKTEPWASTTMITTDAP